jgi:hypothetical protein
MKSKMRLVTLVMIAGASAAHPDARNPWRRTVRDAAGRSRPADRGNPRSAAIGGRGAAG